MQQMQLVQLMHMVRRMHRMQLMQLMQLHRPQQLIVVGVPLRLHVSVSPLQQFGRVPQPRRSRSLRTF